MATLSSLRKKIALLEAQVERVTKAEMGAAISKVRKLMSDFGLTVEHLAGSGAPTRGVSKKSTVSKNASGKKVMLVAAKAGKPARYADPKTGATWSGFGRAPGWIAGAKSRDAFLVNKASTTAAEVSTGAKKVAKKASASAKKAAVPASQKAAVKTRAKRTSAGSAPKASSHAPAAKKASAKSAASKTTAAKKATADKAAVKSPTAKRSDSAKAAKPAAAASSPLVAATTSDA